MRFWVWIALAAGIASGQSLSTWDSSGNGLLKGTYNFRDVAWLVGNSRGDLSTAALAYGTVTFDGNGNYTAACTGGNMQCYTTGQYRVSSGGFVRMDSIWLDGYLVDGMISNGVFLGSATEAYFNDLFIATQSGGPDPALSSSYIGLDFNTPSSNIGLARDAMFPLNFNGAGSLGSVSATGYIGQNGSSATTQAISGATYAFANGVGTINFGGSLTNTNLLAGSVTFYASPDGSFLFGGSTTSFDMFVAVKAPASTASGVENGFFYQAGLRLDESTLSSSGYANLQTYYSAFNNGAGSMIAHKRVYSTFSEPAYDWTYWNPYTLASDGTYPDQRDGFRYYVGDTGQVQIGFGLGPAIGINAAVKAPAYSGTGPFINPNGVVNAGGSTPFTVGVAPGEWITLYGTNLASSVAVDGTLPTTLGGVTVLINGRPAPINIVSPTQINAQVPYNLSGTAATIVVFSGGQTSNTVTVFVKQTSPGVLTDPAGGIGYVKALHVDGSVITKENPAKLGEAISLYMIGLGAVSPAVTEGTPAPFDPLSTVTGTFTVFLDNEPATASYVGLAPGWSGLYQVNITVPATVTPGDPRVGIGGPDAFNQEAVLPVASN